MTRQFDEDTEGTELDAWMMASVKDAMENAEENVEVPREMMWARMRTGRRPQVATEPPTRWWNGPVRQGLAAAALLFVGIAIGRYAMPAGHGSSASVVADGTLPMAAGAAGSPVFGLGFAATSPDADADDPLSLAMREHLSRSVALLTMVGNENPQLVSDNTLGPAARDLLITTRLLLDEPRLENSPTKPVLQDLELVLLQIIQARPAAPETQAAPRETMVETNLLPRVKAVVMASSESGDTNPRGEGLP